LPLEKYLLNQKKSQEQEMMKENCFRRKLFYQQGKSPVQLAFTVLFC